MTVPTIVLLSIVAALLLRLELRSREHSIVEWAAWETRPGTIRVINEGRHIARHIQLEAWDDERYTTRFLVQLDPGETWDVELPHRRHPVAEPVPLETAAVHRVPDRIRRHLTEPGRSPGIVRCPHHTRALDISGTVRSVPAGGAVDLRLSWHSRRGNWRSERVHV